MPIVIFPLSVHRGSIREVQILEIVHSIAGVRDAWANETIPDVVTCRLCSASERYVSDEHTYVAVAAMLSLSGSSPLQ